MKMEHTHNQHMDTDAPPALTPAYAYYNPVGEQQEAPQQYYQHPVAGGHDGGYQVVQQGSTLRGPRGHTAEELQQFNGLAIYQQGGPYQDISPSPETYTHPLSPPLSSGSESAEAGAMIYQHSNHSGHSVHSNHSRTSSGAASPVSSRGSSLVHRSNHRYNPTPSPTTSSSGRRGRGRSSQDSDEEEGMGAAFQENIAQDRKEVTRKQRIEAEQRRRDELRDGYAKLKDVLPMSNQKSSKVSLLERATNHITHLEAEQLRMREQLEQIEAEVKHLRELNEKISLATGGTPPASSMNRPLSPPPEGNGHNMHHHQHGHSLVGMRMHSRETSPGSDGY